MTQPETYNGWKNYETWNVNLWLANDEPMYRATVRHVVAAGRPIRDYVESVIAEAGRFGDLGRDPHMTLAQEPMRSTGTRSKQHGKRTRP